MIFRSTSNYHFQSVNINENACAYLCTLVKWQGLTVAFAIDDDSRNRITAFLFSSFSVVLAVRGTIH